MEPENMNEPAKICVPGMRLNISNDVFMAGPGTNEIMGYIYASVAGFLKMTKDEKKNMTIVSVVSPKTQSVVPRPGDIVTCRVTVVNPRVVYCSILCVNSAVLTRTYKGVIKKEDIQGSEKTQVDPYKSFRSGDIILAKVLPLTELHYYVLSTAECELGVAIATAEGSPLGVNMVPVSWSEMQCPKTLVKEKRKVARIIPEKFNENLFHMITNGDVKKDDEANKKGVEKNGDTENVDEIVIDD